MEEHEHIQIRSDEVEDILGRPPSWIVRWGITIIFLTLIGMGVMSWLVQYSDVIPGSIVVTTPSPPMNIVAETSGRLEKLNVVNDGEVKKGDLVAVIESSANYEDMMWLDKKVQNYTQKQIPFSSSRKLQLGDVQIPYSEYLTAYNDYSFKVSGKFEKQQVEKIYEMIKTKERKIRIAEIKERKLRRDIQLLGQKVNRYRQLLQDGAVSVQDLENVTADYNRQERGIENIQTEIVNYENDIERLEAEKISIQRGKVEGGNDRLISVMNRMNKLAGYIDDWKKSHLIEAPVDGKITLFDIRAEEQYVNAGQKIMMIIPKQEEILGRMIVSVAGLGKIEKGHEVNIFLHEYPSKEYGVVKGNITRIDPIPKDDTYQIDVAFPKGLVTTYKKELDFKQEMSGMAEIITDKKRFIFRIFDQFRDLFENR